MDYIERLEKAIDYVIDNDYPIYNRELEIRKRLNEAKNVCIFGLGEFFEDCGDFHVPRYNYVSDNDPHKWGKTFKGKLCLPPEKLLEIDDLIVFIMVGEYRPIYEQLKNMGLECYPCDYLFLNVCDTHYDCNWFKNNKQKMLQALESFADEQSKEVYTEAILNRIAPQYATKIFNEIKVPGEYYQHGVFEFSKEEFLVDAGAYIGDSIERFVETVQGEFGGIYAFELDNLNYKKLEETVKSKNLKKVELFNAGVFNENKEVAYGGEHAGAYVFEGGQLTARVVKLDDSLSGKRVTFIKMDVEGSELAALEGAKEIIKGQKPKLAISAYHFLSDLWEVPIYIKQINKEYQVYMRHHAPVVWDTDCYAY